MEVPEQPSGAPAHPPSGSSPGAAEDRPADGAGAAGNDEPHAQHDDTGDGAPHGSAVGRAAKTTSRVSVATGRGIGRASRHRSEEHTTELQSRFDLVCCLLLEENK